MNKNQYLDESGDTGYTNKSTKYFIVNAINTDDIKALRHIAKKVQRYKKDKKAKINPKYIAIYKGFTLKEVIPANAKDIIFENVYLQKF